MSLSQVTRVEDWKESRNENFKTVTSLQWLISGCPKGGRATKMGERRKAWRGGSGCRGSFLICRRKVTGEREWLLSGGSPAPRHREGPPHGLKKVKGKNRRRVGCTQVETLLH